MGSQSPSSRWFKARRPGRRERERVKHRRGRVSTYVPGVGSGPFSQGQKKWRKVRRVIDFLQRNSLSGGEPLMLKTDAELANGQAISWLRRHIVKW